MIKFPPSYFKKEGEDFKKAEIEVVKTAKTTGTKAGAKAIKALYDVGEKPQEAETRKKAEMERLKKSFKLF